MSCDHQFVKQHLIDYIEDSLTPIERQKVENSLDQCDACLAIYRQALTLQEAAHNWQPQPVPNWHRTEFAVRPKPSNHSWLSWSALATSTLAILMVIFQVQISTSDEGVKIAFGDPTSQHIESLITKQLADYKKQQNLLLDARFVAQTEKVTTTNKLLMAEFMEKTRDERRDDLSFLITGIQNQRHEDQQKVEKRLSYLADNQIENNQYINQLIQSATTSKGEK